jgi:type IV pilus assembly protein PilE
MMKRANGFTLIELMIVVVIIGIIASVAYPSYQDSIKQSRRNDAQGVLTSFAAAMERRYTIQNTFTGAAAGGADTGAPAATVFPSEAPLDGSSKYYDLTIQAATATTFTLRAAPKGAQAGDGYLELLSSGLKRWDVNGAGTVKNCWRESDC